MRINQNIMAFNAYRNLNTTSDALSKSLEKLSSGFRINRAADDAAGLVKSESLRAEIGGTNQAISNAQDGVSFVQTSEGALNEVQAILQRVRDLSVSAANTATTDGSAQQAEINQLTSELDAIGARTTFGGKTVFTDYSATGAALAFQVGAGAGGANQLSLAQNLKLDTTTTAGLFTVQLSSIDVTTNAGATSAIALLDSALANVSSARSALGATQNRFEHIVANLSVAAENLTSSESRVRDTDMSVEMVKFTRDQIMNQAGTAMLAQANQVPQSVLKLLQ
jgi:flagellin